MMETPRPLRSTEVKYCSILTFTLLFIIVVIISTTSELLYYNDLIIPSNFDTNSTSYENDMQSPNDTSSGDDFPHKNKNNASSLFNSSSISSDNITIFFNLFFAEDNRKAATVKHALSIVEEQLNTRSASIFPEATLYYMSLGKDVGNITNCTNCERLDHKSEGNEILTLSKLYKFCLEHPDKNVAYIHNKGSFNPSKKNDLLRRMLTKAVFSEECLLLENPTNSRGRGTCNVCSARFSPLPHFHTSGNMWVGSCSYISKLIPPEAFGKKMNNATECAPNKRFGNASEIVESHVGRGRYAAEHWVHSHPDVIPCDVYPGTYVWNYERLPSNDNWKPDLAYAPRFPMIEDYEEDEYLLSVRKKSAQGAWFSLVGRIHEWKAVYGKVPNETSWVWNYYKSSDSYGDMK